MKSLTELSKFIALILRHKPETIGISLDQNGWANVGELIDGINQSGHSIDMETLEEIVRTDEKGRYSFNDDKTKIRANQGHSVNVDVELKEVVPPEILFHGTGERFSESIKSEGLKPMSRLYVHLSKDVETAVKVGKRHGKPFVFVVKTGEMYKRGYKFWNSENGVWLTKAVPPEFLEEYK